MRKFDGFEYCLGALDIRISVWLDTESRTYDSELFFKNIWHIYIIKVLPWIASKYDSPWSEVWMFSWMVKYGILTLQGTTQVFISCDLIFKMKRQKPKQMNLPI